MDNSFRYTVIGVSSFNNLKHLPNGKKQCDPDTPQVYATVATNLDWIIHNTKEKYPAPWKSNCQPLHHRFGDLIQLP